MGSMVNFTRPDGKTVSGYLAEPAQGTGGPAVVVLQEWWGLNAQIRGVADRLAAAGVVWYGCPPLDYVDASKIKVPLQGHWATQDDVFKIETVDALEAKLSAAGVGQNIALFWKKPGMNCPQQPQHL
jgi:dienelactone hydrolase